MHYAVLTGANICLQCWSLRPTSMECETRLPPTMLAACSCSPAEQRIRVTPSHHVFLPVAIHKPLHQNYMLRAAPLLAGS